MSAIYNLEPQPTASAILHTTLGEISVELFAKQTPLTCRNFLQLALDGYYDDTIFHRLVPKFIVQGGDPTGTGNGGESIYDGGAFSGDLEPWPMDQRHGQNAGPTGINFKDEFHSRLKFNRRGLLGVANDGRPDTNGSQFFFTLDKTEELNGRNTLFGRVAGDTIYNLMKIAESEVDQATERPLYPVKIQKVEILVNPFTDMTKRTRVAHPVQLKKSSDKDRRNTRKGGKQLLSFGDEEGGDDEVPVLKKTKYDTRIVTAGDDGREELRDKRRNKKENKGSSLLTDAPQGAEGEHGDEEPGNASEETNRGTKVTKQEPKEQTRIAWAGIPTQTKEPRKSALEKANEELAALKASMRRMVQPEKSKSEGPKSTYDATIPETSMRARKRRPQGKNFTEAEDTKSLRLLQDFQSRLAKAPEERTTGTGAQPGSSEEGKDNPQDNEGELCDLHFIANCQSCTAWDKQEKDESDDEGWMSHSLSFAADKLGKDLRNRKKAEEELVVIDPRERARSFKEEKQAQREARTGGSGRAWDQARDQARNAKMANAASLAGRGAK